MLGPIGALRRGFGQNFDGFIFFAIGQVHIGSWQWGPHRHWHPTGLASTPWCWPGCRCWYQFVGRRCCQTKNQGPGATSKLESLNALAAAACCLRLRHASSAPASPIRPRHRPGAGGFRATDRPMKAQAQVRAGGLFALLCAQGGRALPGCLGPQRKCWPARGFCSGGAGLRPWAGRGRWPPPVKGDAGASPARWRCRRAWVAWRFRRRRPRCQRPWLQPMHR